MGDFGFAEETSLIAVVLALLLSAICFGFIFVLDKMMDRHMFGDSDDDVESFITSLGILIGFAWEQCFDSAVATISEGSAEKYLDPSVTKMIMSFLLVAIVFPAWRMYILKTELECREMADGTMEKVVLNAAAGHMAEFLKNKHHDEHDLDQAHLKMKEYRREAFGQKHPRDFAPNLVHLQVTTKGIKTMPKRDAKSGSKKAAHIDVEDLTVPMLFDHMKHAE